VPAGVQGKIKVAGVLEGWPFPVKEHATELEVVSKTTFFIDRNRNKPTFLYVPFNAEVLPCRSSN
jgi:hypothetical protein